MSSDEAKQRYTEAVTWLRDVGAGRAGLLVPSENTHTVASPFRVTTGQAISNSHWDSY